MAEDVESISGAQQPIIVYGKRAAGHACFFESAGLLEQKGIKRVELKVTKFEETPVLFPVGPESALPFDPFSASFYLVSRYEEYGEPDLDQYGRFAAEESVAFKRGFLQKPVINFYAEMVARVLGKHFPQMEFRKPQYRFLPTYDVDSAYAYKHKGVFRNTAGLIRSMTKLNTREVAERINVLFNRIPDPFDSYEYIEGLHAESGTTPVFFFLMGDYDEFDKNISSQIPRYQQLIRSVADFAEVGIHPSFASALEPEKLKTEIDDLGTTNASHFFTQLNNPGKLLIPGYL